MADGYDVGYGKPPKHAQFGKGRSGNPKGRPKGAKNIRTELREELQETVRVREGTRQRKLTKQRVAVKQLTDRAAQGDHRAMSTLLPLALRLDEAEETAPAREPLTAADQEILEALRRRLSARSSPAAAGPAEDAEQEAGSQSQEPEGAA